MNVECAMENAQTDEEENIKVAKGNMESCQISINRVTFVWHRFIDFIPVYVVFVLFRTRAKFVLNGPHLPYVV